MKKGFYITGVLIALFYCQAWSGNIVERDSFFLVLEDCDQKATLCLPDILFHEALGYQFQLDGVTYPSADIAACDPQSILSYNVEPVVDGTFTPPFRINEWKVGARSFQGQFGNINELLDSMNTWDPDGNWQIQNLPNNVVNIIGGNLDQEYSNLKLEQISDSFQFTFVFNFGVKAFTGFSAAAGPHQVVVFDPAADMRDTFYLIVSCPVEDIAVVMKEAGSPEDMLCPDFSLLAGPPVNSFVVCEPPVSAHGVYQLDPATHCMRYRPTIAGGPDTVCWAVCDAVGNCILQKLVLNVLPGTNTATELEITIGFTGLYCLDTTRLDTSIADFQVKGLPAGDPNINLETDADRYCIQYEGIAYGRDTLTAILTDSLGHVDSTTIIIHVVSPKTAVYRDTIEAGAGGLLCLEREELSGSRVGITRLCPETAQPFARFTIDNLQNCVNYRGARVGTDSTCFLLCDDKGICDTTIMIITVIAETIDTLVPQAFDDSDTTAINKKLVINFLGNDDIPNNRLTDWFILLPAANGTATADPSAFITYEPATDFCGIDSFTYVICNLAGCDTATVRVVVDCSGGPGPTEGTLQVFNGFSPNNDGINDVLFVQGLAEFPEHTLTVFNRWGIKVFESRDYRNDWRGTWEGKDLPDGTYFYLLETSDGNKLSGYLQLKR